MQADGAVLLDAIVEAGGLPGVGEEGHRDRLAEIVELEARGADGREDGGVVDGVGGDVEGAGAEEQVGMGCCSLYHAQHGLHIHGHSR